MDNVLFGIILIFMVIALVGVVYHHISEKYTGYCRECGKEFKATTMQLICTTHVFYKFYIRCPHCGHKGLKQFKKE